MDKTKLDRQFTDAVRGSGLVSTKDLEYALTFQSHASKKTGARYPLDRILLKFGFIDSEQILGLYKAIRYYYWRREDKFFLKLATQSKLLSRRKADRCLREQKDLFKTKSELRRVNEIARRRCYITAKQEIAIIEAMKKCRAVTVAPTEISLDGSEAPEPLPSASSEPTKKTSLDSSSPFPSPDVQNSSRDKSDPFDSLATDEFDQFDEQPSPLELDSNDPITPPFDPRETEDEISPFTNAGGFDALKTDDEIESLLPLTEDDLVDNLTRSPKQRRKKIKRERRADPFNKETAKDEGTGLKMLSDDDLDALWEEADLDDIDLDSDNRNVAQTPLLDSEDDLDYSSSDDLF